MPMTDQQCKRALSALSTPEIHGVVDLKKLMVSELWKSLIDYSTRKIVDDGDATAALRLLSAFDESKVFKAVLAWYCARAGMKFQAKGSSIKFQVPSPIVVSCLCIDPYLKAFKGTKDDVISGGQYLGWQSIGVVN